jgi:hypothetical protein
MLSGMSGETEENSEKPQSLWLALRPSILLVTL